MIITPSDRKKNRPDGVALFSDCEVLHNTRVKRYPDGTTQVTFCRTNIYKERDFVVSDAKRQLSSTAPPEKLEDLEDEDEFVMRKLAYREQSIKRSKNSVFDIVLLNEWDFFFTGTLKESQEIDRYDPDEVCQAVNRFMYNQVRNGIIVRYIFVPEFHDDYAIHYHGFIKVNPKRIGNGFDFQHAKNPKTGKLIYTGRGKDRRPVYNWLNWEFGFTNFSRVYGTKLRMTHYICKYVTKMSQFPMKHRYYAGGDVLRKVPTEQFDVDFNSVPIKPYSTQYGTFKYITFPDYNSFVEFLQVIRNQELINAYG